MLNKNLIAFKNLYSCEHLPIVMIMQILQSLKSPKLLQKTYTMLYLAYHSNHSTAAVHIEPHMRAALAFT